MEAPKCKVCGERHYGTCLDHEAKGSLSARVASGAEVMAGAVRVAAAIKGLQAGALVPAEAIKVIEKELPHEGPLPPARKQGRPSTGVDRKEQKRIAAAKRRQRMREGK